MCCNYSSTMFSVQNELLAISEAELTTRLLPLMLAPSQRSLYERPRLSGSNGFDYTAYCLSCYTQPEGVLVLPIKGMMSRNSSYYNEQGNDMLMAMLERAAKDDHIKGVVFDNYSGGGTVDSTKTLADAIAKFPKPTATATAFCCSAAYWAASATNRIFVEPQSATELGSIGTIYFRIGQKGALEAAGYSIDVMRSGGAPDKALDNGFEDLTQEVRATIQAKLDVSAREFVAGVKLNRVGKLRSEGVFTGKTYGVNEAIGLGLADQKGTLSDAIKWVLKQ